MFTETEAKYRKGIFANKGIQVRVIKYNPNWWKVSGVKKAAKKKAVSSHKDTKSHNVNIRVVSGFNSMPQELMYLLSEKRKAEENFAVAKANYKKKGIDKESKEHYTFWYNRYRDYIKHLNKRILIVKRHIK
jgi:hypothetical protein